MEQPIAQNGSHHYRPTSSRPGTASAGADEPFLNFGGVPITNSNLLHCLSVIEQKTNELLIANFTSALPKRVGGTDEKDAAGAPAGSSGGSNAAGQNVSGSSSGGSVVGLGLVSPQQTSIGGLLGQGPLPAVGNISIVAPSTGDEHDTDEGFSEEDERPLSRDELTQKTLRGLSRRTVATVKTAKSKRRDRF